MNHTAIKFRLTLAAAAITVAATADIGDVRLKGWLGEKLDAMIERHIVAMDVDYISAPFLEKTERGYGWQTEFWGKWMHSSVPYAQYATGETAAQIKRSIERGIDRIVSSQEKCGYIGSYPDDIRLGEGWDVWGIKYTMMGLLHYYDGERGSAFAKASADKSGNGERAAMALEAAKRLCDYVIAEIGPNGKRGRELWQTGNWSGYASSSILEPVVWLYRRTQDRKYLDFASYIVKGMTNSEKGPRLLDLALKGVSVADRNDPDYNKNGNWSYVCKNGRSKAYEMMSCYQGLLEYWEVVENSRSCRKEQSHSTTATQNCNSDKLLQAAIMTAEDIVKEEINLAGGCASSEAWFHGASKQHKTYMRLQETCVTTTWLRLCEKLLAMTDDPKWADQLEKTFYNAYLAAMRPDGSEFAGYTPLAGCRWHGQHHCRMHIDCCNANGPRGFLCFLNNLFRVKDGVATFNFYGSALAKGKLADGRDVAFDMYSLYPRSSAVHIVSHTEGVGSFPLRLRIPGWCNKAVVKLNHKEMSGVKKGSYFEIVREWKLGDRVDVWFEMPTVAHVLNDHIAFTRGPVLLARDSRFGDGDMSEPIFRRVPDGKEVLGFFEVRVPSDDIWMAFSATLHLGSHDANPEGAYPTTVSFCDYASAANTWRRDDSCRTWFPLLLRPTE